MTKFSEANLFGMTIRESANDGSDFTNPDADYRRLFVGEDGLFHLKDSAGTVTTPTQGALTNPMTTKGDVILGDTGGTPSRLGAGTSGYVLTSNGAAAFPSWQAAGGGGSSGALVLLATQTASSSATLDFTTRTASGQSGAIFQSDFDEYQIDGLNLICSSNTQTFGFRAGTGGGPTYDSASNYYGSVANGTIGYLIGTQSNAAQYGQGSFSVVLVDPQNAVQMKNVHGTAAWHDGTNALGAAIYKLWAVITAMTAIQFLFTSGNITSGIVRIYGVAKT